MGSSSVTSQNYVSVYVCGSIFFNENRCSHMFPHISDTAAAVSELEWVGLDIFFSSAMKNGGISWP